MADQNKIAEMLEHLVNDQQDKAEELFHEYIVEKSREIYEGLIEAEIEEETSEDEEVDEAAEKDEDSEDEDLDENFEDLDVAEADDETDDLVADVETDDEDGEEMGDEGEGEDEEGAEEDESLEDRVMDLEDHMAELEAEFAKLQSEEEGEPFHGGDEEMKDEFELGGMDQVEDLETVREYVEKVAPAKMGDNGANTKSIVAGKNDMGGTTANIVKGGESNSGGTKGGLANPSPKEDNAGNINVPGGKAGDAFKKNSAGHGAEKKGAGEKADNTASLFRK